MKKLLIEINVISLNIIKIIVPEKNWKRQRWIFHYFAKSSKKFCITDEVYYVIYYSIRVADPDTLIVFYMGSCGTYKRPEN